MHKHEIEFDPCVSAALRRDFRNSGVVLCDARTGLIRCRQCGASWNARIRPDSAGRYYRGSRRCPQGCNADQVGHRKAVQGNAHGG